MAISKEDVIANLRALIISSKGGLHLSEVEADYRETFGVNIPLKSFECNSLEQFIRNNPENFTLFGVTVQAVVKNSSVHIASLVNRQQTSKKKGQSNLIAKQTQYIRKPWKFYNEPSYGRSQKRPRHFTSKPRKHISYDNPPSLMSIHWSEVAVKPKNAQEEIHKSDKYLALAKSTPEMSRVESTLEFFGVPKNYKLLREITRTVPNENASYAKESIPSENIRKNPTKSFDIKAEVPFDDFEDLHVSSKAQSRLLKYRLDVKRETNNRTQNGGSCENDSNSNPGILDSPFGRALANNPLQGIFLAKKSPQANLENNNIDPNASGSGSLVGLVENTDDDMKYEHKLKQFCRDKGLIMPEYLVMTRNQDQAERFGCKLTIGNSFQVSTYPVETHSAVTARELAAKKAYNQLLLNRNFISPLYETDNIVKLVELCLTKNLPDPVFKSMECHPKNEPKYFICKVRIGDEILLSSYPIAAETETIARDAAVKKALDYLSPDHKSLSAIRKADSEIVSEVFKVVKMKGYGVWVNKLRDLYAEVYNEELPKDWYDIVVKSSKFEVSHIDPVGPVLRIVNSHDDFGEQPVLATLEVPESNQWEVYITNVVTSAEIWCRLIGKEYNEVYDAMMTKLELEPPTVNVQTPVVGEIYLVNLEESWNRVRVTETHPDKGEISVFLIDLGVDEVVKVSQLFHLDAKFFSVAPQAILLSLNELDCLADCEELQNALLHTLLGNIFIAEVVAILDEGGNVSSVNLWDTSTEEDINVNIKLLGNVIGTIKSPSFPTKGTIKEMFISYVDDNGEIYVQDSQQGIKIVSRMISTKMNNCERLVPVVNKRVNSNKLYITRCGRNGLFYRAKLLKNVDQNTVSVKFIDYGQEQQVSIDSLFDLEETSIDLATIPSQAIRVKLSNLKNFNETILNKLRGHIMEQKVLVKVIEMPSADLASVELFKRSQSDGTLSSINNIISKDKELQVVDTPTRKKSYVVDLESTIFKHLPMPDIPPIGNYFNVFVTLAANPGLINVQPLATQSELMDLMFRLQEKCEATFSKPLTDKEFKIGELYAVKHADNFWYRSYAHVGLSSTVYTVCLCDFGDFLIVPAEKLMPLPSEFKTFPYQAIRAYLTGIAPVDKDWSVSDCIKFRELVIEKHFVSQVVEINRDLKNPNYVTLGLKLVDTSTNVDIYIHQLLVDKKMAVFK